MEKTGSIDRFERLLLREEGFMEERGRTLPAIELSKVRLKMIDQVKAAGKTGDIDLILGVEHKLLENDLDRHANSKAMSDSLKVALSDMAIAEKHLMIVRDPAAYRVIDEGHSRPKNRVNGVPPRMKAASSSLPTPRACSTSTARA